MNPPHGILLVEDSRTQASNLCEALEREGWIVDWAPTVETAMERLNRTSPDLIMLDYYLPGILGDELCRRIRMSINTRSIPILMLTMDETHEAEVRGLESGADDFVSNRLTPKFCWCVFARCSTSPPRNGPFPAWPTIVFAGPAYSRLMTVLPTSNT